MRMDSDGVVDGSRGDRVERGRSRDGESGNGDPFDALRGMEPAMRDAALAGLHPDALVALHREWQMWAHPGRREPPGDWRVWVLMAGRGFGKTRTGAEWVHGLATGWAVDGSAPVFGRKRAGRPRRDPAAGEPPRFALVGASLGEARAVMVEGPSGILARADAADARVRWYRSDGRLAWANGAEARLFSGAHPDGLRGPEHHYAWCDELAKWPRAADTWANLQMGLRAGPLPRALVTTTPRPLALLSEILRAPDTAMTHGRTADNPYLPPAARNALRALYDGTRLGRQELDGEMIVDVEGSLWTRDMLDACRTREAPPPLARVVIGVDPPGGSGRDADACGIVAAGLGAPHPVTGHRIAYVLEDATVRGARPEAWAAAVVAAYRRWNGSRVVAEKNQGGEMVDSVLRAVDAGLPITLVHASKGKVARAEPVAALYERGRVRHAGAFPALEDEMAGMTANGGYEGQGAGSRASPDRADALVWALSALMLNGEGAGPPRVRSF